MQAFAYNRRCCATCVNWLGARRFVKDGSRYRAEVDSYTVHGKCCLHPLKGGFSYGPPADFNCSEYVLCPALK